LRCSCTAEALRLTGCLSTFRAIRIVQDLGLQHEASPFHNPSPLERARRRLVFWSVFFLDRVISYGTGRCV
jgi:hypothetical protein